MEHLSEDTIKRVTLQFMKTYYKFRPRTSETIVRFDKTTASGLLIDGHLTFPQPDGKLFTATFEATSNKTIGEVRYTLHQQRLTWDALMYGSVVTFALLAVIWLAIGGAFFALNWLLSTLIFVALVVLTYVPMQFVLGKSSKYRYIYAIEQFKQYDADEQWIALGEDVFADPNDPHLEELRKQCVQHGFGLVVVNQQEQLHLDITPSRQSTFQKSRKVVNFIDQTAKATNVDLQRFKSPYGTQMAVCCAVLVAVSSIFYGQYKKYTPTVTASELYIKNTEKRTEQASGETRDLYAPADTSQTVAPNPNEQPYEASKDVPMSLVVKKSMPAGSPKMCMFDKLSPTGFTTYDDCNRYDGTFFIIQDSKHVYPTFAAAFARMEYLKNKYGLIVNCIATTCVPKQASNGFIIFFNVLYRQATSANAEGLKIRKILQEYKESEHITIREL